MIGKNITQHHFIKRDLDFTGATNSPFAVGVQPFSVAVADVNGDGKLDIVTALLHK